MIEEVRTGKVLRSSQLGRMSLPSCSRRDAYNPIIMVEFLQGTCVPLPGEKAIASRFLSHKWHMYK